MDRILTLFFVAASFCVQAQLQQEPRLIKEDTTISFGQVSLQFKQTAFSDLGLYPHQELQDFSLEEDRSDVFGKTSGAEEFFTNQLTSPVKRTEKNILVKLKTDEWVKLSLNPQIPISAYSYEYYFQTIGLYCFKVQAVEGVSYLLISNVTGESYPIIGKPYLAPNNRWILALGNENIQGKDGNELQLIAHSKGQLREVVRYVHKNRGLLKAKWVSNSEFILEYQSGISSNEDMPTPPSQTKVSIVLN